MTKFYDDKISQSSSILSRLHTCVRGFVSKSSKSILILRINKKDIDNISIPVLIIHSFITLPERIRI